MSEHPWTPAPWRAERYDGAVARGYDILGGDDHRIGIVSTYQIVGESNGPLIALAPEMAEALFEVFEDQPDWKIIDSVMERLREIGTT